MIKASDQIYGSFKKTNSKWKVEKMKDHQNQLQNQSTGK